MTKMTQAQQAESPAPVRPRAISVIDTHVEGEPARLVLGASELLRGASVSELRADLLGRQSWLRTSLMHEPRGHRDMFGVVVVPATHPAADIGAIFIDHEGSPTSCGHGTIALASAIAEGRLMPQLAHADTVTVETVSGLTTVQLERGRHGDFQSVVLHQPPMRVVARPLLPHPLHPTTQLRAVLAHGATTVLLVADTELGIQVAQQATSTLISLVQHVREAALSQLTHAAEQANDLGPAVIEQLRSSPVAITGKPVRGDCTVRTFVSFAERSVDRSPCGSAVTAVAAWQASEGHLAAGVWQGAESLSGGRFEYTIAPWNPQHTDHTADRPVSSVADAAAPVLIRSRGYVTGTAVFEFAEGDRLRDGFSLG